MAQTTQYTKILLSEKTGKEVSSYSGGYGTAYDVRTRTYSIIDSLGNITFETSPKERISHIGRNRFILTAEEPGGPVQAGVIDEKGNTVIPSDHQSFNRPWLSNDWIISSRQGKDAVYDNQGKQILPYSDRIRQAGKTRFFVLRDNQWFLYDFQGRQMSSRSFKKDYDFEEGRALINNENGKSEIIGTEGQTLHQFSKQISDIHSYPFLITKNQATGKYGIIDTEENILAEEVFDGATPEYFNGKHYIYLKKKGKVTVFDKEEKKLYPNPFKDLIPLSKGLFRFYGSSSNKSGIVTIQGEVMMAAEYDYINNFTLSGKNFIYLKKGKEEKLLDKDLQNILEENMQVIAFYPGFLIVKKDNGYYRFSVTDRSLAILKDIVFIKEQQPDFYNILNLYSKPVVCKNSSNLYGILDENGKETVPFIYDDIVVFENAENEIVVKKDGKFGVTNFQNEPLKKIMYDKYIWLKEVLKLEKDRKTDVIYFTRFKNIGSRL
ncbi:MAG: WG repeat-containing protein [Chryseobacterium sp.]|jgi:hypothetical protein|uniref:WG repeat-containing protein n=1 Tax=Chryseobacterium sp. TaxID=1871047 RepID=UPI0028274CF0|nr:WG repeat-containing protein [Chryseobacterium sp.]MDR2238624.1 WG repeat-containing protein [Chryseobacterium sp.]